MAGNVRKLKHFALATALLANQGCAVRAEEGVTWQSVEEVVPPAEITDSNPRAGRLGPLRDQLEEKARLAAEDLGIEGVPYSAQIGPRGEYLLSAAMGPGGGVFFIAPFLGPYPGPSGHDPWVSVTVNDGVEVVAVCRIVVIRDPSTPYRAAKFEDFMNNWPDYECNEQEIDMEQRAQFDERLVKSGYSIFRETTMPDGGKAWLVELPDGDNSEFDVEKALDLVAGDRRIVSSMALFPFDRTMGVADLGDGTRLFFYDRPFERSPDPRVCIVQGIAWNEFASWRHSRGDSSLQQWCDDAMRAQTDLARERMRNSWEGEPGPVIRTTPLPSAIRD